MRIVHPDTMRAMDKMASEQFGIPGILLMEQAARQTALEVLSFSAHTQGETLLLAGPGNNGGDAFGAARYLLNSGCSVRVASLAHPDTYTGDAAVQLRILLSMGVPVVEITEDATDEGILSLFEGVSVVADGLFGTGLSRAPRGVAARLIHAVNQSGCTVVSIDIPSGVDAATGQIPGAAIRADATVTLALGKLGLYLYPGAMLAGRIRVADIGMPVYLMPFEEDRHFAVTRELVSALLPQPQANAHKGSMGTVLSVAGSQGMTGAAALAARAAYRGGAGLVRCCLPDKIRDSVSHHVPEAVYVVGLGTEDGLWAESDATGIRPHTAQASCLLMGPGMPQNSQTDAVFRALLEETPRNAEGVAIPIVLDAGALNFLAKQDDAADLLPPYTVLTPHPGEMARLCRRTIEDILSAPAEHAGRLSDTLRAVVVLKGAGTIIASPDGRMFVNTSGNYGMASAGSGDVLAGLIAALAAQGMDPVDAAVCGVYLHGLSGDLRVRECGPRSLIAGDIADGIGEALYACGERNGKNL